MEGVKIAKCKYSYLFMKSVGGGEAERSTGNTFLKNKKGWELMFSYYFFDGRVNNLIWMANLDG